MREPLDGIGTGERAMVVLFFVGVGFFVWLFGFIAWWTATKGW